MAGSANGYSAARCVYLADGAVLAGFTLTNGASSGLGPLGQTPTGGGGVWCQSTNAVVTNCVLSGNYAEDSGGGAYLGTLNNCTLTFNVSDSDGGGGGAFGATLNNCTLTGNSAGYGGGAHYGTLNNCTLMYNSAFIGGGASYGTLNNCTLTSNLAQLYGGGTDSGVLNNCTLTGNSASNGGGGTFFGTLSNCTLANNSAYEGGGSHSSSLTNCTLSGNSAGLGGGAYENAPYTSTLDNCTLTDNSAQLGAGAYFGTLNNCTLTGNSGFYGGGAYAGALANCILYYNTATRGPNYWSSTLNNCCAAPLPASGAGNITNPPLFVDRLNGNLRLQSNSPCINTGLNAYAPGPTDLDGNPRIVSGTVDIGAYEFQGSGSLISYAWLQQYGLPTDGSADTADSDHDGANNWQEWLCGTDPTNALSVLRLLAPTNIQTGLTVTWQSVTNRTYFLERSTNLSAIPSFLPLAAGIPGQSGTTTYTDTNAPTSGPSFYRIGIQ